MKLLVFAHTPPPHHGQSFMVRQMLEGFGGDCRTSHAQQEKIVEFGVECYHVNARLSKAIHDIGGIRPGKLYLLMGYCLQAIWCRFRYGVTNFYYVTAPGQRAALYRDWLVMFLCRPFFNRVILHWHAAGLTEWLEKSASATARWLTRQLLGKPALSIVLSKYNVADGERLGSNQVRIVHNGISDPCPDFAREVLPRRLARFTARSRLAAGDLLSPSELEQCGADPNVVKLLYLAHCSREKGLFDALNAVSLANKTLRAKGSPLRFHLTVAGDFVNAAERVEFDQRIAAPDLQTLFPDDSRKETPGTKVPPDQPAVRYAGFMSGEQKKEAFARSDCFCLPTYYANENQPVTLIEAMAFGLPIVTTRWRSLPELFDPEYPGLIDPRSPEQLAAAVLTTVSKHSGRELREKFLAGFTLSHHLHDLARALQTVTNNAANQEK